MRTVVDRIEGDYAVLLCGDREIKVNLPRELLPPGAGEGSILRISLELDEKGTREQRERISRLLDKLKGQD